MQLKGDFMQKTSQGIDPQTQKNIDSWLSGNYDEETKNTILQQLQKNPNELTDAFYTHLSFGTGGLRGVMGVGCNRMNVYTVRGATQGLANYINNQPKTGVTPSVVIGYDSRKNSHTFAQECAKVLAANRIKVFLFQEMRPVPFVSFAVLQYKCSAGIMITASHNPPKYNGYKVYWSYGGQVLPPHDQGIIQEVNKIKDFSAIKTSALNDPLIEEISESFDDRYLKAIHPLMLYPGDNHSKGRELKIVYTPLHGTGFAIVPKALKDWGFVNLELVQEQSVPDGNFPTIKTPNPEDPEALTLGIKTLKKVNGDILIGTDADTDRIGVVIQHKEKQIRLTGNEVACLAVEHICQALQENHQMPPKPVFMKTIVTSELFRKIAEYYRATCIDVLTGFKYIGEKIHQWEEEKKHNLPLNIPYHHFLFGGEESYGYLLGTHARDKDAIVSANLVSEIALHQKLKGKTLLDFMFDIYLKYGIYREKLVSLTYEGKAGQEKIKKMMENIRNHPPKSLNGIQIESVEDYLFRISTHFPSGKKEPLLLPESDVLRFWLADETKLVVRPSGTEPKIKFYAEVVKHGSLTDKASLETKIKECDDACTKIIDDLKNFFS